ncbi:MAG: glycosyltransferase [Clostridia bacterium]|nr:glycosyltransferase [Clostridia bacterium]
MKVVQINATCGIGSTGKICVSVSRLLSQNNIENYILYSATGIELPNAISCSSRPYIKLQSLKSHIIGEYGFLSGKATKRIINVLNDINPDIVHLHNIHGHDCNLEMLFSYLRENKIKIFWTFHDCWAFTGYCPHYTMAGCEKWKNQCERCPQKREYTFFFDKSKKNYNRKKELLKDLDLTIITPSEWLKNQVKESFLKAYPVKVINNGIDLNIFKPQTSDFRQRHGIEDKYIVLGVSFKWDERKGIDKIVEIAQKLRSNYKLVLVGADEKVKKMLPDNVIAISSTNDQKELAEIYSASDVFINLTKEDTFPTVNIEALACGLPVITTDAGGSPEILTNKCGTVIADTDVCKWVQTIEEVCEKRIFTKEDCIKRASAYDRDEKYKEYLQLYLSYTG